MKWGLDLDLETVHPSNGFSGFSLTRPWETHLNLPLRLSSPAKCKDLKRPGILILSLVFINNGQIQEKHLVREVKCHHQVPPRKEFGRVQIPTDLSLRKGRRSLSPP